MKHRKPISLRRYLLILIVVAWILPITMLFFFISSSYRNSIIEKTERLMREEVENFVTFHAHKLDEAIDISKEVSYDQTVENTWNDYDEGKITSADFYKTVTTALKSKFANNNRFVMSVFYRCDSPDELYYTARKDGNHVNNYTRYVHKHATEITDTDSSDAYLRIINGEIYVIRNMYTTRKYHKFGTLIIQLDKNYFFDNFFINQGYTIGFFLDSPDSLVFVDENVDFKGDDALLVQLKKDYEYERPVKIAKRESNDCVGYIYQQKFNDYNFAAVIIADKSFIYAELYRLMIIIALSITIAIPVFGYMLVFITKHIRKPISSMIDATKEIEQGNIGAQIKNPNMPNVEFNLLAESFNKMSAEVKYLFNYAYTEELARKEAKIIALQSQINPHFLNNTLEMMNWQARLSGDIEVSKMIEALGTLLDYSMDRTNKKLISLSEELRCADAYLYIISMRFGQRLRIEKDIDPKLLQLQVPQLMLQPILENAVMHGIEIVKSGIIRLKVFREDDIVKLQIINTGKGMTDDDVKRVNSILDGTLNIADIQKGKHTSLGIRNVNERIKLIFGDRYGLTIKPYEGTNEVVSTITIPFETEVDLRSKMSMDDIYDKMRKN